jgi:rare lipoprotein A
MPSQTGQKFSPQTARLSPSSNAQPVEAVKVGEYQSQAITSAPEEMIAKIEAHEVSGRPAATLYVRNIPVLTFMTAEPVTNRAAAQTQPDAKMGQVQPGRGEESAQSQAAVNPQPQSSSQVGASNTQSDPVWRAMSVAAKLNQLSRDNIAADTIAVRWNGEQNGTPSKYLVSANSRRWRDRYIIQVNGQDLVEINTETRLPDTTRNLAEDALQATNRLRRLLGGAPPLREIAGRPAAPTAPQQVSLVTVLSRLRGWASWYGPGFHGNRSASGEVYNQNALTAAHRSLPFGTQVRVTNLNNGVSVVVRINDRGPFVRGRIIDLSAAAARVLGMMGSGVAPVSVEVLGRAQTVTIDEGS